MKKTSNSKPSAQNCLKDLYAKFESWKMVAAHLSTPERKLDRGMLRRIANGKQRAPNSVLIVLGLPPNDVLYPACAHCGKAKAKKNCGCRESAKGSKRPSEFRERLWYLSNARIVAMIRSRVEL